MKKSLIFIPLMAVALVSCTSSGGGSKKKKSSSSAITTSQTGGSGSTSASTHTGTPTNPTIGPIEPPDLGPEEYQNYRRVMTAPENGKEYLYGIYQDTLDKNIFLNGDHHRDDQGEYPFYLTTTDDVTKAVKVVCNYTDDTHFDIKIIGGGEYTTYDNCYLEIYEGVKTSGQKVTSLRAVKSLSSEYTGWYFLKTFSDGVNSFDICTNVTDWTDSHGTNPVGMATYDDKGNSYETFSACTNNHFFDNFMSHLWEPIE